MYQYPAPNFNISTWLDRYVTADMRAYDKDIYSLAYGHCKGT